MVELNTFQNCSGSFRLLEACLAAWKYLLMMVTNTFSLSALYSKWFYFVCTTETLPFVLHTGISNQCYLLDTTNTFDYWHLPWIYLNQLFSTRRRSIQSRCCSVNSTGNFHSYIRWVCNLLMINRNRKKGIPNDGLVTEFAHISYESHCPSIRWTILPIGAGHLSGCYPLLNAFFEASVWK